MTVRPIAPADRPTVQRLQVELWGSEISVGHGVAFRPAELAGFLAEDDGKIVGMLTYVQPDPTTLEVVTIDAMRQHQGIGTVLLDAAMTAAADLGARRVVLTTTNDNVDALRFYQRRGFRLVTLRPGAVHNSRQLKPEIPLTGAYDIPLTDELDLERPV
ncbi:MAG TPA: GNAT family N-acetyltransferase [Pseudonocardiaceae bacterium]|nr:GNAT family N-acetyltransferase [Pseudonocardiaceae bacterium]